MVHRRPSRENSREDAKPRNDEIHRLPGRLLADYPYALYVLWSVDLPSLTPFVEFMPTGTITRNPRCQVTADTVGSGVHAPTNKIGY